MTFLNNKKLVLASQSPRRKQLLTDAGIDLLIKPSRIDESQTPFEAPEIYPSKLSTLKAEDVASSYPDSWILGADTIVVINKKILEKPNSRAEAVSMLQQLSNNQHKVYTGICLVNRNKRKKITRTVMTQVFFKNLSPREIDWYINTGEPFDKAGGYGIQDKGAFLIKKIIGSYTNVVGLPVSEIFDLFLELKIIQI